jgi:vitamin B12 transporter
MMARRWMDEQRNLQWGNNVIVGHGSVSAALTGNSSADLRIRHTDTYKRDNTGLYLTGQQQFGDVTWKRPEDHDEQFGWHGTWQTTAGWEFVDGYRVTLATVPASSRLRWAAVWFDRFGIAQTRT